MVDHNQSLSTHAFAIGIGAAQLQIGRPIAVASQPLTHAESRYANIDLQMLSAVFRIIQWHYMPQVYRDLRYLYQGLK